MSLQRTVPGTSATHLRGLSSSTTTYPPPSPVPRLSTSPQGCTSHFARRNKYDNEVPARFDTVPINTGTGGPTGTSGYRVAQVRVVFKFPDSAMSTLFPNRAVVRPDHLAYVEWVTAFPSTPHPDHGLYKISRSLRRGDRIPRIVPVQNIARSCHLFPDSGAAAPRTWASSTVLEHCTSFFVNSFADRNTNKLIN
ncbi:hypothetical protein BC628DRAFT_1088675 [Trametes gibbosa]|nr:hypothetical protein BC628DRAFT_1088675 [Trametes gibbosa]